MSRDQAHPAPDPRPPARIRNVALVGHSGCGKTTLAEALLAHAGAIPRPGRVEEGSTVCDSDPLEVQRGHSVALACAALEHDGVKVNLLDTPGTPDFVGELRAGLRAADAALFVVSAVQGVDALTVQLWEECAAVGMPRAVCVTQLDRPRADVDEAVAVCQRLFGDGVHPLYLPMLSDDESVAGLVGLLDLQVRDSSGGQVERRPAEPEHVSLLTEPRGELLEGIIAESEDETLLERYLAGEQVELAVLVADLEQAVARGHFHPVLPVAPQSGVGVPEVLDLLVQGFPSPLEHGCPPVTTLDGEPVGPVEPDPEGPLVAEVLRTTTDPYVGRVHLVRVFSGTLRPDLPVHVSGHGARPAHDSDERTGPLGSPLGATLRPVAHCPAGDICTVAKLRTAEPGDTVSAKQAPLLVAPWDLPEPQLPVAVAAASRTDEDKLAAALVRLAAEDPAVRVEQDPETGQQVLWCVGEAHAEVLLERLRTRTGVQVLTPEVLVPLRETLRGPATGTGRLVKQSGGHGQYAVVVLEVAPGQPGSGLVFSSRVVGGAVPTAYVPSVEKGVRAQMERGITEGRPLVDLVVTLVDGKAHSVDSSDAAFAAAAGLAIREAAAQAGTCVLEPWAELAVTVPVWATGAVMSDLSGRRGRVTGTEPAPSGPERTVVRAEVPEVELLRYAPALRQLTHGTGSFTRRRLRLEPMPG